MPGGASLSPPRQPADQPAGRRRRVWRPGRRQDAPPSAAAAERSYLRQTLHSISPGHRHERYLACPHTTARAELLERMHAARRRAQRREAWQGKGDVDRLNRLDAQLEALDILTSESVFLSPVDHALLMRLVADTRACRPAADSPLAKPAVSGEPEEEEAEPPSPETPEPPERTAPYLRARTPSPPPVSGHLGPPNPAMDAQISRTIRYAARHRPRGASPAPPSAGSSPSARPPSAGSRRPPSATPPRSPSAGSLRPPSAGSSLASSPSRAALGTYRWLPPNRQAQSPGSRPGSALSRACSAAELGAAARAAAAPRRRAAQQRVRSQYSLHHLHLLRVSGHMTLAPAPAGFEGIPVPAAKVFSARSVPGSAADTSA